MAPAMDGLHGAGGTEPPLYGDAVPNVRVREGQDLGLEGSTACQPSRWGVALV